MRAHTSLIQARAMDIRSTNTRRYLFKEDEEQAEESLPLETPRIRASFGPSAVLISIEGRTRGRSSSFTCFPVTGVAAHGIPTAKPRCKISPRRCFENSGYQIEIGSIRKEVLDGW